MERVDGFRSSIGINLPDLGPIKLVGAKFLLRLDATTIMLLVRPTLVMDEGYETP